MSCSKENLTSLLLAELNRWQRHSLGQEALSCEENPYSLPRYPANDTLTIFDADSNGLRAYGKTLDNDRRVEGVNCPEESTKRGAS
jgi:hypothetical protein